MQALGDLFNVLNIVKKALSKIHFVQNIERNILINTNK